MSKRQCTEPTLPLRGRLSAPLVRCITRFLTVHDRTMLDVVDKAWNQTWDDPLGWAPRLVFRREHVAFRRFVHVRPDAISISTSGVKGLSDWLQQTRLVEFDCEYPESLTEDCQAVLSAVASSPRLERLCLRGWHQDVTWPLTESRTLRFLQLNNFGLGRGRDRVYFFEFIRRCPELQHLDLTATGLSESGARLLADVLCHLKQLRVLSVDLNDLGDEGFESIKSAALSHPTLGWVGVRQNYLMDSILFLSERNVDAKPKFEWLGLST